MTESTKALTHPSLRLVTRRRDIARNAMAATGPWVILLPAFTLYAYNGVSVSDLALLVACPVVFAWGTIYRARTGGVL